MHTYPPWKGTIFREKTGKNCKVQGRCAMNPAKPAEPIEMPFGMSTRLGLGIYV